jgi:hypothetical protein
MKIESTQSQIQTQPVNNTYLNRCDSDNDSDTTNTNGGAAPAKKLTISMPIFKLGEYEKITPKLSLTHLKRLCSAHGLKRTGTRPILCERVRSFCLKKFSALKIQRLMRGHISRTYVNCFIRNHVNRGHTAVNDTDFYTMDEFKDVPHYQTFRFKDECDGMAYQFNMASFFKLIKTTFTPNALSLAASGHYAVPVPVEMMNPYTRSPISTDTVRHFFMKMRYSRMMRHPICVEIKDDEALTPAQLTELRIVELFQDINKLGNYADSNWFSKLTHPQHIRFIQELYDIWSYRAELTQQTRNQICPPYGHLFSNPNSIAVMQDIRTAPFQSVADVNLGAIDRLIRSGVSDDDRSLGAFYVLSALTIVSPGAREAMPWLYQSVAPPPPQQIYQLHYNVQPQAQPQAQAQPSSPQPQHPQQAIHEHSPPHNNANYYYLDVGQNINYNDLFNHFSMHINNNLDLNDAIYEILNYAVRPPNNNDNNNDNNNNNIINNNNYNINNNNQ